MPLSRHNVHRWGVSRLGTATLSASHDNQGGDWLRLWSSTLEKRAVVSGATLKSRNKKQTRTLNSRSLLNK
jgi:hypothetical protein